jgi:hypothetical protein
VRWNSATVCCRVSTMAARAASASSARLFCGQFLLRFGKRLDYFQIVYFRTYLVSNSC